MIRPAVAILYFEKSAYGNYSVLANELKDIVLLSDQEKTGISTPNRFELVPLNLKDVDEANLEDDVDEADIEDMDDSSTSVSWQIVDHYMNMFSKQEEILKQQITSKAGTLIKQVKTFVIVDDGKDIVSDKVVINKPDSTTLEWLRQELKADDGTDNVIYFDSRMRWDGEDLVFQDTAGIGVALGESSFAIKYTDTDGSEKLKEVKLYTVSADAKSDENYMAMIEDLMSIYEDIIIDSNSDTSIPVDSRNLLKELDNLEHELNKLAPVAEEALIRQETKLREHKVRRFTAKTIADLNNDLNPVRTIIDGRSYDIYEHRMIKAYLERVENIARKSIQEIGSEISSTDDTVSLNDIFDFKGFDKDSDNEASRVCIDVISYGSYPSLKDGNITLFSKDKVIIQNMTRNIIRMKLYELNNLDFETRDRCISELVFHKNNRAVILELLIILGRFKNLTSYQLSFMCSKKEDCYDIHSIRISNIKFIHGEDEVILKELLNIYGDKDGTIVVNNNYEKLSYDRRCIKNEIIDLLRLHYLGENAINDITNDADRNKILDMKRLATKEEWREVISKISNLKRHDIIRNITTKNMEYLKITNLFSNQVNYRNIYKILRQIPDDSFSATVGDRKKKAIAKACNIYEYWCLVKILWIFIKEYGFCLVDEAGKDLNNKNSEAMIKKLIKSYFNNPEVASNEINSVGNFKPLSQVEAELRDILENANQNAGDYVRHNIKHLMKDSVNNMGKMSDTIDRIDFRKKDPDYIEDTIRRMMELCVEPTGLMFKLRRTFKKRLGGYNLNYKNVQDTMEVSLIYQGELQRKSSDDEIYRPDFMMRINYDENYYKLLDNNRQNHTTRIKQKVFVFDAKYRDYSRQGLSVWCKTLYEVAAYKYMADAKDVDGAYILQSDVGGRNLGKLLTMREFDSRIKTCEYYGFHQYELLSTIGKEYFRDYTPEQKMAIVDKFKCNSGFTDGTIGAVGFLPYKTEYFKNLIRMLMERFVISEEVYERGYNKRKGLLENQKIRIYPMYRNENNQYVRKTDSLTRKPKDNQDYTDNKNYKKIRRALNLETWIDLSKGTESEYTYISWLEKGVDVGARVRLIQSIKRNDNDDSLEYPPDERGFEHYMSETNQSPEEAFMDIYDVGMRQEKDDPQPPLFCWMCGGDNFVFTPDNFKGYVGEPYICTNPLCKDPFMIKSWCATFETHPMVKHYRFTYNFKTYRGTMYHVCPRCHNGL